jgi:hypothetical protein
MDVVEKPIVVEKGVDCCVAGAVEGRADGAWRGLAEINVRDRFMMIGKCHPPGDATFIDAQIGEKRVGLQNVINWFEGHTLDPILAPSC